jgi:hypothetical protein
MESREQFYDEHIAPALLELARKCEANGLSMLATVQFGPADTDRGDTVMLQPGASLSMVMVRHCMKTAPNIDGFMIGLTRYCNEKGIDTSSSIYMSYPQGAA